MAIFLFWGFSDVHLAGPSKFGVGVDRAVLITDVSFLKQVFPDLIPRRVLERLARLQSARNHGDAAVCCTPVEAGVPQSSV